MMIDYVFIKHLLETMQKYDSHAICISTLTEDMRDESQIPDIRDHYCKTIGHLYLLRDARAIESLSGNPTFGITHDENGIPRINDHRIRMTMTGYDMIHLLKKQGIIDKLKRLGLGTGKELARIMAEVTAKTAAEQLASLI